MKADKCPCCVVGYNEFNELMGAANSKGRLTFFYVNTQVFFIKISKATAYLHTIAPETTGEKYPIRNAHRESSLGGEQPLKVSSFQE